MGVERVDKIVVVMSGKGGVGKSTVSGTSTLLDYNDSVGVAVGLVKRGFRVGVLDLDLTGPSIPGILGCEGKVLQGAAGWVPVHFDVSTMQKVDPNTANLQPDDTIKTDTEEKLHYLKVMSIAFLLPTKDTALIWRGPKKTAMIRQFFTDVIWSELDYLVVDTPPGTGDEHISLVEVLNDLEKKRNELALPSDQIPPSKAKIILVTTPQEISLADTRKTFDFCQKSSLSILGVVENMSGYECEECKECTWVFGRGKVGEWAERCGLEILGRVPICEVGGAREISDVCEVVVREMR